MQMEGRGDNHHSWDRIPLFLAKLRLMCRSKVGHIIGIEGSINGRSSDFGSEDGLGSNPPPSTNARLAQLV